MRLKQEYFVLPSYVLSAAAVSTASALPPHPPEYGLRGLRRIELVFVNVVKPSGRGGVMATGGGISERPGTEALGGLDLATDPDCQAIGPTLVGAGIEIVERCRRDDAACGKLFATMEIGPLGATGDRTYLVGLELTQRLQLVRDSALELSVPTSWTEHRLGVVAADHSVRTTSCIQLRDLGHWFAALWKEGNK